MRQLVEYFEDRNVSELLSDIKIRSFCDEAQGAVEGLLRESAGIRISLTRLFSVLGPALLKGADEPEEGWLKAAYDYLLDINFGHGRMTLSDEQKAMIVCALITAQAVLDDEREHFPFDCQWDFAFCDHEEMALHDRSREYQRFLKVWKQKFIYEMMRIGQEVTHFLTLQHIAGVHHVAMTVARSLAAAGESVNLTLLSAAAALHDIGKYGCLPGERVPYLHYYYTDKWCNDHRLSGIGRIASNHSAWDLEAENLSAESLALIYADFRVKQTYIDGVEKTEIFTLKESYDVILNKLDDVDAAKNQRYRLVYAKLFDFERFMIRHGVDVTLEGRSVSIPADKDSVFYDSEELSEAFHLRAVRDNLHLTRRFGQERLFSDILEAMRSESDWIRVQAYLGILREYYNYLDSDQKMQAMNAMFDLLVSPERDISREAASVMGIMTAHFNMGYRKQMPDKTLTLPDDDIQLAVWSEYLKRLIYPERHYTTRQRSYLHYTLGIYVQTTLGNNLERDEKAFRDIFMAHYEDAVNKDEEARLALLQIIQYLPMDRFPEEEKRILNSFAMEQILSDDIKFKASALMFFLKEMQAETTSDETKAFIRDNLPRAGAGGLICLNYLKETILKLCGIDYDGKGDIGDYTIRDIFLDDFKTATPWQLKIANVYYLSNFVPEDEDYLHIATHLANLVEVSEIAAVRYSAGEALLSVCPHLTSDQKNEVALELARGLEVNQFEYSKYIPTSFGRFILHLREPELDEMIDHLEELLQSSNDSTVVGAMATISVMLENYRLHHGDEPISEESSRKRYEHLLGIVLKMLSSHREIARQEALLTLSRGIFNADLLTDEEKARTFEKIARKLLFILRETLEDKRTQFFQSAMLSHIYRFILRWESRGVPFDVHRFDRIAFFPGTFDPFSMSHKEIVRGIRNRGFEVYLAIDEFSWRKKTEPSLIRRRIAAMSVADEFHVTLFPHDISINIANPKDLECLREMFPDHEVYLVVGSDVLSGASAYRALPTDESIHHMNHFVIQRDLADSEIVEEKLATITGDVVKMVLPDQFTFISSSLIRENIDRNQDISGLVDRTVMTYITENGLYRRQPMFKPVIRPQLWTVDQEDKAGSTKMYLTSREDMSFELASVKMSIIRSADLYHVLGNEDQAASIRRRASGRLLSVDEITAGSQTTAAEALQILMTDVLVYGIEHDCDHAIFRVNDDAVSESLLGLLKRQGFVFLDNDPTSGVLIVSLRSPIVLFRNIETMLKDLFEENVNVRRVIDKTNRRLQEALTQAYPGEALLTFNAGVLYDRLLTKITALNNVPDEVVSPRILGDNMCVPFGKVLRGVAVPNTVTKTLFTEKVYESNLLTSEINSFPNYAPLRSQARMLKSFNRPVLLVDDLLHTSRRIEVLNKLFKEESVELKKFLVCVLSSRGRDKTERMGIDVDCVYFIPNMRAWYADASLYPFIGGDTIKRTYEPLPGFRPAINMVMPYTNPDFYHDSKPENSYEFSRICLENARDIMAVLESEYRRKYARNLTLSRLSDVLEQTVCPDRGNAMRYDPNKEASYYLDNDLKMLERMKGLFF